MPRAKKSLTIVCAFCKLPIQQKDRPSVRLGRGKEAHMECYREETQQNKDKSVQ